MQETGGLIPGSGRSPGEGNGYPLQYSFLDNPMDRGALEGLQSIGSQRNRHDWVTKHVHQAQGCPNGCLGSSTRSQVERGTLLQAIYCIETELGNPREASRLDTRRFFVPEQAASHPCWVLFWSECSGQSSGCCSFTFPLCFRKCSSASHKPYLQMATSSRPAA